jgi:hypothetical protein
MKGGQTAALLALKLSCKSAIIEVTLLGYQIEDVLIRHPMVVDENIKWLKEKNLIKLEKKTN